MSGSTGGAEVRVDVTANIDDLRRNFAAGIVEIQDLEKKIAAAQARLERATEAAARQTQRQAVANDNAADSSRRLGQVMGQAGFQIQDFAGQVAAGQSALVALGQQGSQLLGVFGTAGAIAGAALTVGVLAAQFLIGKDSAAAMAEAVAEQEKALKSATAAAGEWREGIEKEGQQVLQLQAYYASLSEERRAYELRNIERMQRERLAEQDRLRADLERPVTGLSRIADMEAAQRNQARLPDQPIGISNADLDRIRSAVAAVEEVRRAGVLTQDSLASLSARMRELAEGAADTVARRLRTAAEEMEKAGPKAGELSSKIGELDNRFRALTGQLTDAQRALARLRETAAENPFASLNAEASQIGERLNALNTGGLEALERVTRGQQQQAAVTRLANEAQERFAASLRASGVAAEDLATRLEENAPAAVEAARRVVEGQAALDAARRAAEERARAAAEAGRRRGGGSRGAENREMAESVAALRRAFAELDGAQATARANYERIWESMDPVSRITREYEERLVTLREALSQNAITEQEYATAVGRAVAQREEGIERLSATAEQASSIGREMGTVFTSAFDGILSGSANATDALQRFGQGVARLLERTFITRPLEAAASSLFSAASRSLSGMFGNLFGSSVPAGGGNPNVSFGGPRAAGGPVDPSQWYLVGERGPEIFVPNTAGTIVANDAVSAAAPAMAAAGGGGAPVTINIDARGAEQGVEARIDAVLARRLPGVVNATKASLMADVNRGGRTAQTFGRRA